MIHKSRQKDRAEPGPPDCLILAWRSDHERQAGDREEGAGKFPVWLIRALLALIFCASIASPGVAQVNRETGLTSEKVVYLVGDGTSGPYRLKDHHIVLETDTIRRNGLSLRRGHDYSMDYNSGHVTFFSPIYTTDTLEVSYEKLNLNLKRRYFHRELVLGNSQVHRGEPSSSARKAENATLETRKWGFLPQKVWFERHHTGAGKQQGGVAVGHQRGTGDNLMPFILKEAQESLSNLVTGHTLPALAGFIYDFSASWIGCQLSLDFISTWAH